MYLPSSLDSTDLQFRKIPTALKAQQVARTEDGFDVTCKQYRSIGALTFHREILLNKYPRV